MSKTARQAERVTGHPPGMLQDDSRELTAWLANKPDAMRHAREAAEKIREERKPCRCGPDMCADSAACPRHNPD